MEKIIEWQSRHLEVDPVSHRIISPADKKDDTYYDDDDSDEIYEETREGNYFRPQLITNTVFGQFEISDELHPYKEFQLWQADTNFKITKGDWKKLTDINGIEILVPITRYKFIVGVGKLFSFSNVRVDIEFALCQKHKIDIAINHITDTKLKNNLINIKSKLKDSKSWAIYIFPNGNIDYTTIESPDFAKKMQLYIDAYNLSNGVYITNG